MTTNPHASDSAVIIDALRYASGDDLQLADSEVPLFLDSLRKAGLVLVPREEVQAAVYGVEALGDWQHDKKIAKLNYDLAARLRARLTSEKENGHA